MDRLLIANKDSTEIETLKGLLSPNYHITAITDSRDLHQNDIDIVLLDSNFSKAQGIDVLMELMSMSFPVLMVINADEPECAAEAMRIGAANYLIKTANYLTFVGHTIQASLNRLNSIDKMKDTIKRQRIQIGNLEQKLRTSGSSVSNTTSNVNKTLLPNNSRKYLIQEIVQLLQRDEINLPSYPDINLKMRELMQENAPVDMIANVLKNDAVVTSKLLNVANSAYYQGVSEIITIEQAISRLGLVQCKNFVEVISNRAMFTLNDPKYRALLETIWSNNIACAHISYALGCRLELESSDALFTMGMLHGIGKLLLLQILSELSNRKTFDLTISEDEVTHLINENHARFGATLLKRWKFSTLHSDVVRYHESLDEAECLSKPLQVVNLANIMARDMGYGEPLPEKITLEDTESAISLKLPSELLIDVQKDVNATMENNVL